MPRLTNTEGDTWAGFVVSHGLVSRELDAELRASSDLTLSEFEILLHLAWAGGERRMAQIAHDAVLTGGGVTRIVARLQKLGYITRRSCPKDGRGVFAALTERGWAKQRAAQKIHVQGVKRLFFDGATADDLAVLSRFFKRVVGRVRGRTISMSEGCAQDEPTRKKRDARRAL